MEIKKPGRKKNKATELVMPPKGKMGSERDTVRLNVNVPRDMYRALRIKAAENDTSVSRAVIGLIENYVTRR